MIACFDALYQQNAIYGADYYSDATLRSLRKRLRMPNSDGESNSAECVCYPPGTLPLDETSFVVSSFIVDLPISRSGISADAFTIPTSEEFKQAQESDTKLQLFR